MVGGDRLLGMAVVARENRLTVARHDLPAVDVGHGVTDDSATPALGLAVAGHASGSE